MPDDPYRAPRPPSPDAYTVAWADLWRRRVWTGVLFAAFSATQIALTRHWSIIVALGTMVLGGVVVFLYPVNRFRCPHCGKKGGVVKKCKACGIPVGTPKSVLLAAEKDLAAATPAAMGRRVAEVDESADDADADVPERAHRHDGAA